MTGKPLLIKSGHVIDPAQNLDAIADVLVANGSIVWVGSNQPLPADHDTLPAHGMVVCPGFIDMHCHLRQPGYEEKETIATGTQAAARGGFTTVCCMPNTSPPLDNTEIIDYVNSVASKEGIVRVLPICCISQGRAGKKVSDMVRLAKAGAAGFSDDGSPVTNDSLMIEALSRSRDLDLPVIDHCEDISMSPGWQINEGLVSVKTGLRGMPASAEERLIKRDIRLAELTGGRLHIAHVSSAGGVDTIREAKARNFSITAEVTPHHLVLTEESVDDLNTNAKVSPPLRTQKDIDALIEGLNDGTIDVIATDHAPHTAKEKARPFIEAPFGISGLETALGALLSTVHNGKISLNLLIGKLTTEPAKIIGKKFGISGSLAIGRPADITVLDPDYEWTVDPALFASKGKNTPLAGATLRGKVMATFYQGNLIFKDESVPAFTSS